MDRHPQFKAWSALIAVYFFWGTTYLAIRMSLEMFPPLMLVSVRFLLSGGIILIAAKCMGARLPAGRELGLTALYGAIVLGGGNGCLTFAQLWVPSGTAALLLTMSPFWMVGLEALLYRKRIHYPTLIGIAVGFLGILILIGPAVTGSPVGGNLLKGFFILQLGCFLWCFGSLMQRRQKTYSHPIVSGAIQQLATGLLYVLPAAVIKEHPVAWSTRSLWALGYLVVFGSIVGYSAYIYSMEHLPVPIVSTHMYVNPIVAVFLGWLFYAEPFGTREAIAIAAVFSGVALVRYFSAKDPQPQSSQPAPTRPMAGSEA